MSIFFQYKKCEIQKDPLHLLLVSPKQGGGGEIVHRPSDNTTGLVNYR